MWNKKTFIKHVLGHNAAPRSRLQEQQNIWPLQTIIRIQMQQRVLKEENDGFRGGSQYRNPRFYFQSLVQQPQIHRTPSGTRK